MAVVVLGRNGVFRSFSHRSASYVLVRRNGVSVAQGCCERKSKILIAQSDFVDSTQVSGSVFSAVCDFFVSYGRPAWQMRTLYFCPVVSSTFFYLFPLA